MTISDHIETILLIALRHGEFLRFPHRFEGQDTSTGKDVGYACEQLDELGCTWAVQNTALCYINDADTPKVWAELHSRQLSAIAQEIINQFMPS
jgi:hypothetical protein